MQLGIFAVGCAAHTQRTPAPEPPHDPTAAEIVAQEQEQARLEAEKVRAAQERARQAQLLMDYDARMEKADKEAARKEPPPTGETSAGEAQAVAAPEPTKPRQLTLPGWEDILVGQTPPTSFHAVCKREPDSDAVTCKACRSSTLPTPCIEVLLDGRPTKTVSMVMATLPASERDATLVLSRVSDDWGAPTRQQPDALLEELDWSIGQECASLVTSWMDTSGPTIRRARQARRVISIRSGGC